MLLTGICELEGTSLDDGTTTALDETAVEERTAELLSPIALLDEMLPTTAYRTPT